VGGFFGQVIDINLIIVIFLLNQAVNHKDGHDSNYLCLILSYCAI